MAEKVESHERVLGAFDRDHLEMVLKRAERALTAAESAVRELRMSVDSLRALQIRVEAQRD